MMDEKTEQKLDELAVKLEEINKLLQFAIWRVRTVLDDFYKVRKNERNNDDAQGHGNQHRSRGDGKINRNR